MNTQTVSMSSSELPLFNDRGSRGHYLNRLKISSDECHIFYLGGLCKEHLIVTALEYSAFRTSDKEHNEKFQVTFYKDDEVSLSWCRFPKSFQSVCHRLAETYGMTMGNASMTLSKERNDSCLVNFHFPKQDNILWFEGGKNNHPSEIARQCRTWHDRKNIDIE